MRKRPSQIRIYILVDSEGLIIATINSTNYVKASEKFENRDTVNHLEYEGIQKKKKRFTRLQENETQKGAKFDLQWHY